MYQGQGKRPVSIMLIVMPLREKTKIMVKPDLIIDYVKQRRDLTLLCELLY
jgi:hypothetical protein